jgi:HPt (histidine-containing phosphotransfer) domain-containing protein
MFDHQISTNGNMARVSLASAQVTEAQPDAVDMSVLLSFEELQEDNEASLVVELIELYLIDASVKIDAIRQAVAQSEKASLKSVAHSLKGSSGTLGVAPLALICEELECVAEGALTPAANGLLLRLEEEFVRVREVLTSELNRRSHEV